MCLVIYCSVMKLLNDSGFMEIVDVELGYTARSVGVWSVHDCG